MRHKLVETSLSQANKALIEQNYTKAIPLYIRALQEWPELKSSIQTNLQIAQRRYRELRAEVSRPKVAVSGWELSHNAAGRAYTLASIYERVADVEIIGAIFPVWGREVWEPIRNTLIQKHFFVVETDSDFMQQAVDLVLAHPYDLVHLSKPRAPNIIFGILYKLIWGAKVIVDIDDEELAIVGSDTALSMHEYISLHGALPNLNGLTGKEWTRFAVGMVQDFDGITVSNPALQKRYGGEIIRHARDENQFKPSLELKWSKRKEFGIPESCKVILFIGTPRKHKGLIDAAQAISALNRNDIYFVIVGSFQDQEFKNSLSSVKGVNFIFLPNQSVEKLAETVVIGDVCLLLQDTDSVIAQFQVPAKLTDALASGVIPIVRGTPALVDFKGSGLVRFCEVDDISAELTDSLAIDFSEYLSRSKVYFYDCLSISAQLPVINNILSLPIHSSDKYLTVFSGWVFQNLSIKSDYK